MLRSKVQRSQTFRVDVYTLASEHMNMFRLTYSALCGAVSICLYMHRSQLGTLSNTSYLWHAFLAISLDTDTDSSLFCVRAPSSPLFHFAMECLMWGVKKSCRVEQCGRAALWPAPSPNLILAVLKIVCVPGRTDRPLFPERLCCPRRSKRPFVCQWHSTEASWNIYRPTPGVRQRERSQEASKAATDNYKAAALLICWPLINVSLLLNNGHLSGQELFNCQPINGLVDGYQRSTMEFWQFQLILRQMRWGKKNKTFYGSAPLI